MPLMDYVKVVPQYLLPKQLLSEAMHGFMHIQVGWIKNNTIKALGKIYKIDLNDAQEQNIENYPHFNAFFTRALKPESRPIHPGDSVWVSPVDGVISQSAPIKDNKLIQAKCHEYTTEALVGGDISYAKKFKDGDFAVIYLSPKDYHRIHMPLKAQLLSMTYVPGDLFAVNPATVNLVPGLFARNERLVLRFKSEQGHFCLVMVGAIFVGSMETVFQGKITPPYGATLQHWDYKDQNLNFEKGEEIGRFNMGSTVVLLTQQGQFPELGQQQTRFIKMGEAFCFPTPPNPENIEQDPINNDDEQAIGGL
ncbi:phosphatidylserine decarboxylase [Thiomicrospira microaerophila]|uniref:archaetidylserine decarboxylase n=1 Tax=Thiomicrospira microaerophila TaxID=406020 RepID=UPI00200DADFF|nr:archaetidylserine decarboxylase [Thiomicrospira microaerophila]UQB43286.1 phosphatidylserine decarboxylase [Thiomicrospira microaerophila]